MRHSIRISGLTDIGRIRARNEDALSLDPDNSVAVVTDGMGGHPGGDVASRVAAAAASRSLAALLADRSDDAHHDACGRLYRAMSGSVLVAHEAVRARGRAEPDLRGMGTTLIAWAADPETGAYAVGHVGDSRAYRLRGHGLERLTRDDTWVQERIDAHQLTQEEAKGHPFAHMLIQCLGLEEPPTPHVSVGHVEDGDVYLLCTDGLVGMLADREIGSLLAACDGDLDGTAQALVDAANERGGRDNITVALVAVRPPRAG